MYVSVSCVCVPRVEEWTESDIEELNRFTKTLDFFKYFSNHLRNALIHSASIATFEPGDVSVWPSSPFSSLPGTFTDAVQSCGLERRGSYVSSSFQDQPRSL